jgi:hypothetical protein
MANLPVLDKRHALIQVDLPFAKESNYRMIGPCIHKFNATDGCV